MNTQTDGRDTRWAEHRRERRIELVESTLRAIRRQGATVSLDDIAAEAGTSKPVIYRHFGDRPGLYRAVVEKTAQFILDDLTDDPVTGLTMRIGERMADILRSRGYDADLADTWGHALVGAVRAATDQWIRSGMHRPADDVAGDLAALVGPAFNLVTTINEEHR